MNQILPPSRSSGEIPFVVWVRTISVFLILLCHITQTHFHPYVVMSSQLFNVGVNIFVIISGYLFGRLGVKRPYGKWLLRRLKRIYVPYWMFLAILLILQSIRGLSVDPIRLVYSIVGLQRFTYVFPGAEHTWFISAILLCYLFTPLISLTTEKLAQINNKKICAVLICLLCLSPIGIAFLPESAILTTVPFYALAFIIGKYWNNANVSIKQAVFALAVAALSFILRFAARFAIDETVLYNNIVVQYSHYIAGFGLFIASSRMLDYKPWRIVKFISNISFEVYLYHYMFMWPPLSVMSLTDNWFLNALSAVVLAFLVAWIMNGVGNLLGRISIGHRQNRHPAQ